MQQPQNPFTTLYVTERMEEDKFPSLFSPVLVPQVLPLFQAGNVVVSGTQGTGKSMLLALLRTDIRLAFEANKDNDYPVQDDLCQFVSAGINLATNQALRFANRWGKSASELQGTFVDYVNTWLLRDLLNSINTLQTSRVDIWERYNLGGANESLDESVRHLGRDPVVSVLLERPRTFAEATSQLSKRIETYLLFLNGKLRALPSELKDRQSETIGHPIAAGVHALRAFGCLSQSTRVIVTIDQFEQLLDFEVQLKDRHFNVLREVIDEAIHLREPTICYRIGTRPYAWREGRSERLRDYFPLDLDDLLSRKEHSQSALFPVFAGDVFKRRLRCFGYSTIADATDPLRAVFGASPAPRARVGRMTARANWPRLLRIPKSFPTETRHALQDLAKQDPLSAKLGIAWVHQQLAATDLGRNPSGPLPGIDAYPWEEPAKQWWKKERISLAVLQMAAGCGQRVQMFGKKDVLDLSGSSILVFGSICQQIWACWIRSVGSGMSATEGQFPLDPVLQDEGVRNASREWHKKISEEPWLGLKPAYSDWRFR